MGRLVVDRVERIAAVLGAVFLASACRISEPKPRWTEAHGLGQFKAIAASARGVVALGASSGFYKAPGDWGRNWIPLGSGTAVALAANDSAAFALSGTGEILRIEGSAAHWRTLPAGVSALFGGPDNGLLAVVDGALHRVEKDSITEFVCSVPARSVSARGSKAYVVKPDLSLWVAEQGRCEPVALDGPVEEVAATRTSVYVLYAGRPFVIAGRQRVSLPLPEVIRTDVAREVALRAISASANVLWALSVEGSAFQFAAP